MNTSFLLLSERVSEEKETVRVEQRKGGASRPELLLAPAMPRPHLSRVMFHITSARSARSSIALLVT